VDRIYHWFPLPDFAMILSGSAVSVEGFKLAVMRGCPIVAESTCCSMGAPMRMVSLRLCCRGGGVSSRYPLPALRKSPVAHVRFLMLRCDWVRAWSSSPGRCAERGWIEGRNLQFHIRAIEGLAELPGVLRKAGRMHPELILAVGSAGLGLCAKRPITIHSDVCSQITLPTGFCR